MQINDLFPAPGSRKNRKRVGRGNGSGHGSHRRSRRQGPELARRRHQGCRLRGRSDAARDASAEASRASRTATASSTRSSTCRASTRCSPTATSSTASRSSPRASSSPPTAPVKVLGDGELTKKLTVKVDKVSGPAKQKIEAAGGTVEAPC